MPNGAMLPAGTAESRKRAANWRSDLRVAATEAMGELAPFTGAIRMMVDFTLPYPRSSIRKYQFGWWPHTKRPDFDKLTRSVCDALKGICWLDDSQICFSTISKSYAWNDEVGANFLIDEMDEPSLKAYATAAGFIRKSLQVMMHD